MGSWASSFRPPDHGPFARRRSSKIPQHKKASLLRKWTEKDLPAEAQLEFPDFRAVTATPATQGPRVQLKVAEEWVSHYVKQCSAE